MRIQQAMCVVAGAVAVSGVARAGVLVPVPVYLNDDAGITVSLGASMAAEPFSNRSTAASLASIIDADSATDGEFHNQSTHVWVTGVPLELDFDLGFEYDLTDFHFWNYHSEGYDVDDIDLTFYDSNLQQVGQILDVMPPLGNNTGSDATEIFPDNIPLSFPSKVQYINAVLSGSNGQVDFNNMGFTGTIVPEPASALALGLFPFAATRRRRGSR